MKTNSGIIYEDVQKCVDEVINYVGKDITFSMTLALGKPVLFINELYRRAKQYSRKGFRPPLLLT